MSIADFPPDEQAHFRRAVSAAPAGSSFTVDQLPRGIVRVTRLDDGATRDYDYETWYSDFYEDISTDEFAD